MICSVCGKRVGKYIERYDRIFCSSKCLKDYEQWEEFKNDYEKIQD